MPSFAFKFLPLVVFVLLFCSRNAAGQAFTVRLHAVDSADLAAVRRVEVPEQFNTQADAFNFIQLLVPKLQQDGYLAASVDSIGVQPSGYDAFLFCGPVYKWGRLSFDSIPQPILVSAAVNVGQWAKQPLRPKQIAKVSEQLLQWCEDNGYPFAQVWLSDVLMDAKGIVDGTMRLDKGPLRRIDSIDIKGEVKISPNYLMRYLDIHPGDPYSEKKLRAVSPRLRELPFLEEAQPWSVGFKLSKTTLNLNLKEKRANQLNAIVGLLPNSAQSGKFLLTVDALFAFQNILSSGESISLTYQNLQYKSPSLKVDVAWPYLFNTLIGVDGHFDYFRQDTSFRRTGLQLGVRYQLTSTDYVRVFYQNQSSRLITVDTTYILSTHKLPDNADVSANGGGVELVLNRTDYRISPRKGWQVKLSTSALLRNVRKNDAIVGLSDNSGFDFHNLYDSVKSNTYQYRLMAELAEYLPLGRKATVKFAYSGGWISGENLFRNELFQIGGFKLLRGFDEQSIYATQYHVLTAELRLLLDRNSYVYLFSDNGYVGSQLNGVKNYGFYNGFGIGTTLETKSGLFTISYALGRNEVNPVQLRQSKIHFGYIAYF